MLILGMLPEVGTIGGVHWKGRRVKDLTTELNELEDVDSVKASQVGARVRSMAHYGLIRSFPGKQGAMIWAKTPAGVAFERSNDGS
jgi:hypothetical protein